MKKLVVFKRRSKREGPSAPSSKPVFDQRKAKSVKAPPAKRSLEPFKERRSYIMIIQYRPGIRKDTDYQKLGFKADGGFLEAAQRAEELAQMVGKAVALDLHEIRKGDLCRVLAVYEVTAFKDWDKEANVAGTDKHVRDILKKVKPVKPISYAKIDQVTVRGI